MLEKAAALNRFECSPLCKELKTQTDIAKKSLKKLDDTYEFNKIIEKQTPLFKKYNRSNLIYNSKYSFYEYYSIKKFNSLSLTSKYLITLSFYRYLKKCNNLKMLQNYTMSM